jgi:hypothetical protein
MNLRWSILLLSVSLVFAESAAGLKWTPPAGWKAETGARPMRVATYIVESAECAVYFFGEGQGGGIQANLDRWKGQFQNPTDSKKGNAPSTASP